MASSSLHAGCGGSFAPSNFVLSGTVRQYARSRPFSIRHLCLDLDLLVDQKRVAGTATLDLERADSDVETLVLDAVGFEINSVKLVVDDEAGSTKWNYDGDRLHIAVPRELKLFTIEVDYAVTPRRGLYFLEPDSDIKDRPRQVWSQCQDQDARYWFPCHDAPDSKMTSELRVSVPEGWVAISNGDLLEEPTAKGGSRIFHFAFNSPHPSYLLTLVAGQFSVLEDRPALLPDGRSIPVTYYVPPGREADGWRSFGITPSIIEHFSRVTGVPFPWSRYSQIVVSDFIFGGMENTTATTLYEHALLDERAAIDMTSADLIAHELAHQWFGDYVTCRDWSEAWLNEGFATFFEHVEREARLGRDEYDWGVLSDLEVYVSECTAHYSRPIVSREYQAPLDLFDRHLYQKGGLVLHMLRRELGDAAFWAGVHEYLKRNAEGIVETTDLKRALEKVSGHALDQFFDQWVFQAGHPEIEAKASFERGLLTVSATQKLPDGVAPMLWTFEIDVSVGSGKIQRFSKTVTEKQATHVVVVSERPEWVAFDPDLRIAAPVTLDFPPDFCLTALTKSNSLRARVLAAQALAKRTDIPSITALRQRLVDSNEAWMLRAECARCLGKVAVLESLEALTSATSITHPKVRRAVVAALASFKQPQAFEALQPIAINDESYAVKAEACRSLGHTRRPEALSILERNLGESSHADMVRAAAFDGLAALRDPAAIEQIVAGTRYGTPSRGRRAAISALGRLGRSRVDREHLEDLLTDRDFFVRAEATRALVKYGDTQSIPALARQLSVEREARVIREIREALAALSSAGPDQLRQLSDEVRNLQRRLDEMSARIERVGPEPSRSIKKTKPSSAKRKLKKRAATATNKSLEACSQSQGQGPRQEKATMTSPVVLLEVRSFAAIVTLNRPERSNALSDALLSELSIIGSQLQSMANLRAVVITGTGNRVFCAGADLKERLLMSEDDIRRTLKRYRTDLFWIDSFPVPVVAALNGSALGGGLELALLCDLRVAVPEAHLGLPETSLAIIPGAGATQRLPRLIGEARAKEMILLGRRLTAAEALQIGLINRVTAPGVEVVSDTLDWLAPILQGAPLAAKAALLAIDAAADTSLSEGLDVELSAYETCLTSEDRREALRAFAEKRQPRFEGR